MIGDDHLGLPGFVPHLVDKTVVLKVPTVAVNTVVWVADDSGAQVARQDKGQLLYIASICVGQPLPQIGYLLIFSIK